MKHESCKNPCQTGAALPRHRKQGVLRWLMMAGGFLALLAGIAGVFLPGLPTTPFVLLAAALFARSSRRFSLALLRHKRFGPLIKDYRQNKSLPLKTKLSAMVMMWAMIAVSALLIGKQTVLLVLVLGAGAAGTLILMLAVPTRKSASRNTHS